MTHSVINRLLSYIWEVLLECFFRISFAPYLFFVPNLNRLSSSIGSSDSYPNRVCLRFTWRKYSASGRCDNSFNSGKLPFLWNEDDASGSMRNIMTFKQTLLKHMGNVFGRAILISGRFACDFLVSKPERRILCAKPMRCAHLSYARCLQASDNSLARPISMRMMNLCQCKGNNHFAFLTFPLFNIDLCLR